MWGDLEARIKSWVARSRCAIRGVSGLLRRSFRAFSSFLLSTLSAIIVHVNTGCPTPLSRTIVRTETGGPFGQKPKQQWPRRRAGAGPAGGALAPGFGFGPNRSREAVALCLPALPLPSSLTPSHPAGGEESESGSVKSLPGVKGPWPRTATTEFCWRVGSAQSRAPRGASRVEMQTRRTRLDIACAAGPLFQGPTGRSRSGRPPSAPACDAAPAGGFILFDARVCRTTRF